MSGKRSRDDAFGGESERLERESELSADALERSFDASQKQTPVKGSASDAAVRTRVIVSACR